MAIYKFSVHGSLLVCCEYILFVLDYYQCCVGCTVFLFKFFRPCEIAFLVKNIKLHFEVYFELSVLVER